MKNVFSNATKKEFMNVLAGVMIIVKKNTKLLLRTKASTLIIILGPLLLIFFAGIAFDNTNLYAVKIGTYSASYNALSNSFIEKLHEKQFKTQQYPSEENCVSAIKEGDVHACIVFAPNFRLAINTSNEISFYLDYSKLNLVWTIMSVMNEQIASRSKELSANLTSEIVRALDFTRAQLHKRKDALTGLINHNDDASKHIYDVSSQLQEIDLNFDPDHMGFTNLTLQKGKVQHWVENSVNLGDSGLQQSLQYINTIDGLVKASSASNDLKSNLHDYLKKTVDDISKLKDRMTTTKNILGQDSVDFDTTITSIINQISQTKTRIDSAASARGISIQELNTVKTLLDKALIDILEVQKGLNDIDKTIASVQVTDPGSIVQPIVTTIKPVSTERSYLNYLFPTLIALIIMYTAILLTPLLILLEQNSPAYFRNYMTPTKDLIFIFSTFATCALLLSVQLFIILSVATIFFSSHILTSLFITLIVCLLTIVLFTFVGMIIGYTFNTEETAILASTFVATGLLFLSDVILPIESMSAWLVPVARYNPFVVVNTLLRKTIVLNATIGTFWPDLLTLLIYCAVTCALAIGLYYNLKRHNLAKYFLRIAPTKQTLLARLSPRILKLVRR